MAQLSEELLDDEFYESTYDPTGLRDMARVRANVAMLKDADSMSNPPDLRFMGDLRTGWIRTHAQDPYIDVDLTALGLFMQVVEKTEERKHELLAGLHDTAADVAVSAMSGTLLVETSFQPHAVLLEFKADSLGAARRALGLFAGFVANTDVILRGGAWLLEARDVRARESGPHNLYRHIFGRFLETNPTIISGIGRGLYPETALLRWINDVLHIASDFTYVYWKAQRQLAEEIEAVLADPAPDDFFETSDEDLRLLGFVPQDERYGGTVRKAFKVLEYESVVVTHLWLAAEEPRAESFSLVSFPLVSFARLMAVVYERGSLVADARGRLRWDHGLFTGSVLEFMQQLAGWIAECTDHVQKPSVIVSTFL